MMRYWMGLGLCLALSLFFNVVTYAAAAAYPNFGPQTYDVHKYYYFGDSTFDNKAREGLDISVDPASVSYQSVKATVTMDWNLIDDRKVTKFIVLANGVNVDEFEPYFDNSLNPPVYQEYYYLDINVSDQYIGSDVYFQVVGLHEEKRFNGSNNVFVVSWSQETPTYHLKPLPVTDSDTHGYLADILKLLEDLKKSLESKLDKLTKAVEDIYTPSPAAEKKLNDAIDNFMDKTPMKQMADQVDNMTNALEDARKNLQNPNSKITFGPEFDLVPGENIMVHALDLTEWKTEAELFRKIMQATLWLWFFQALFAWLSPKLNI